MNRHRFSFPVLLAISVACLLLGSLGTATAVGLTAHTVKKIASKVVKKKAKTLSVAHASSADTATSAASAQQASAVTAYSFTLPRQTDVTDVRSYTFPGLPVGTYLATYDITASESTGGSFGCAFGVGVAPGGTFAVSADNFVEVTGSSVVSVTSSHFSVFCNSGANNFTLTSAEPSTVSFVPVVATAATGVGS